MPICQASGARTIHLAAGHGRNRLPDACTVVDVTRRHRLAQATENLDAGDCCVSDKSYSSLFMRVLWMISILFHGILRS